MQSATRAQTVQRWPSLPAAPVASDVSRCGTGAVTLTTSSPETIYWYSAASGGTLLATASSYTTPLPSARQQLIM